MTSGGKRPGAGRKAIPQEQKRVQVSVTVSPETKAKIAQLRREGVQVSRRLHVLVENGVDKLWAERAVLK